MMIVPIILMLIIVLLMVRVVLYLWNENKENGRLIHELGERHEKRDS